MASLTTCHNTSSGTSGPAKGRTTRKQTSVNGSRRNSSSSSGDRRAISTGMYKPPSGREPAQHRAAQRRQRRFPGCAAISHVAHDFSLHRCVTTLRLLANLPQKFVDIRDHRAAATRAARPPAPSNAPALRNSVGAPRSASDNSAPPFRAAIPHPSRETRRATTPAWDHSNIAPSRAAAPAPCSPDTPPSSAAADASVNCSCA